MELKKMLALFLTILTLTACSNSKPESKAEEIETEPIKKTVADCIPKTQERMSKEPYTYVKQLDITCDEANKSINVFAVVDGETEESRLIGFCESLLQDISSRVVGVSAKTAKYGALYDEYSVGLGVATEETKSDKNKWLINQEFAKSSQDGIVMQAWEKIDESKLTSNDPWITKEEFNKIMISMSYEQVAEIIGSDGEVLSEVGSPIDQYYTICYAWNGEDGISNAIFTFQSGKLSSKSQIGLE